MAKKEDYDDIQTEEIETEEPAYKLKPPDGGWGWIVVIASGVSNMITIPVMQSFALIFKSRIEQLNMSSTDLATIINVNAAFGMGLGVIAGPLLQRYGYRKVAFFGAWLSFIGITATSLATNFVGFLISYSLFNSMGTFLLMSAFSLATNTYFHLRRGYAAGVATTLTGLGPVVMPHFISFLLPTYGTQGTALILGALSGHSIAASLLLQPIKWHMKKVPISDEKDEVNEENGDEVAMVSDAPTERKRNTSTSRNSEVDIDTLSLYGMETPVVVHRTFGSTQQISKRRKLSAVYSRSLSQNDDILGSELSKRLSRIENEEKKSEENLKRSNITRVVEDKKYQSLNQDEDNTDAKQGATSVKFESKVTINGLPNSKESFDDEEEEEEEENKPRKKKNILKRFGLFIVDFFGLDLLKDPHYVILVIGMSVAISAELNFSLFFPLILGDYGFDLHPIATIMSLVGTNDIIFRFLSPFIGAKIKLSNQTWYLISLVMLITARTSLMFFHEFYSAIFVACGLGVAKGFRTVYMGLVIPSYLPLERLAHGSGIQSAVNCLCIVMSIPLMAIVHDVSGSYNLCIAALNCLTLFTVIMWTIQIFYLKVKAKATNSEEERS